MHRWSTSTYKGACSIPEEIHYMQYILPRAALQHPWLLDGIFAFAAFDISESSKDSASYHQYRKKALEYYNKALSGYTKVVSASRFTPDNHHLVFSFSGFIVAATLGLPQGVDGEQNVFARVLKTFDLYSGVICIWLLDFASIMNSPYPMRAALEKKANHDNPQNVDYSLPIDQQGWSFKKAPIDRLDDATQAAFERLNAINERWHKTDNEPGPDNPSAPSTWRSYKVAIFFLKDCYGEDLEASFKGYCLGFLWQAGADFTAAVKRFDQMALLVVLHWAVLLQRMARDFWWAGSLGKNLADEICKMLRSERANLPEDYLQGIAFCREQVDLPTEW